MHLQTNQELIQILNIYTNLNCKIQTQMYNYHKLYIRYRQNYHQHRLILLQLPHKIQQWQ
jgi:hypothetical protein